MATIGLLLSMWGASAAVVALRLLRAECCPTCRSVGSLLLLRLVADDHTGLGPTVTRFRR